MKDISLMVFYLSLCGVLIYAGAGLFWSFAAPLIIISLLF